MGLIPSIAEKRQNKRKRRSDTMVKKTKGKKKLAKQKHRRVFTEGFQQRLKGDMLRARDDLHDDLHNARDDILYVAKTPRRARHASEADEWRNYDAQESGMYGRRKKPVKRKAVKNKKIKHIKKKVVKRRKK